MEGSYKVRNLLNSRKAPPKDSLKDMRGSDDMIKWLRLLDHSVEDLDGLNIIHVAGTKGKGSTCAFAESFLKVHGKVTGHPRKTGLYTSPHIKTIRERIRINFEPISEELFTKRFFEVWDRLPKYPTDALDVPRYLQFLALLSFHVFIEEKVDVAIYETHMGGEYDATNVVKRPIVTGVTTIGMDHVRLLGPSIEDIAWHKAGIFKPGSLAFSALQEPAVAAVLQRRAAEKEVALKFVDIDSRLPTNARALKPGVQRTNCSLALALVGAFLREMAPKEYSSLTSHDIFHGIDQFLWPGRFHSISHENYQWCIDGAHNELSMQQAAQWFAEIASEAQRYLIASNLQYQVNNSSNSSPLARILIFAHFSDRDRTALLKCVARSLQDSGIRAQHVIFSTYDERQDGVVRIGMAQRHILGTEHRLILTSDKNLQNRFSLEVQERYAEIWRTIDPDAEISLERTIEGALNLARRIGDRGNGMQTLVTGSLHLVSGALSLLEPNTSDSSHRVSV
ncbi:MAG: hypothetical protein Q9187_003896 [Circinaria calcarea]